MKSGSFVSVVASCCFVGTLVAFVVLPSFMGKVVSPSPKTAQVVAAANKPSRREESNKEAFLLGVTINFKTEEAKEAFITLLKPLAEYVSTFEPGTISYDLCQSDKDPLQVYMLERYRSKIDYLEVHRKTPIFLEFREKFSKMSEHYTIKGDSYIETNIGFVCAKDTCSSGTSPSTVSLSQTRRLGEQAPAPKTGGVAVSDVYVTRQFIKVNRAATCWLIRRFINPLATIVFVPAEQVAETQTRLQAVGFDAPGAAYPHRDSLDRCSFAAMVQDTPDLAADPVLLEMARIVQAADLGDASAHPAAAGLKLLSGGFPMVSNQDDQVTVQRTAFLYDSLYASVAQTIAASN